MYISELSKMLNYQQISHDYKMMWFKFSKVFITYLMQQYHHIFISMLG